MEEDELLFLYGQSEPEGVLIIDDGGGREIPDHIIKEIRDRHHAERKGIRDVTVLGIGVDHGLGAHSGNGTDWRTTVIVKVRLDYLKNSPVAYARLEGDVATELLAQLAEAVAIRARTIR